jgi:hypothetical protein
MSTSTREKTALHDESYRLFHELKSLGVDTTDFWQPDSYPSRTTNEMSAHVSFLRRQLTKAKSETNTINKSQSQENKNMETGIITRAYAAAKKDATVGAGMTIAHQTVNTLKAPMLAILNKQFKNVPVAAVASMVLETDIGEGAFAIALGALLRNVPDTWTKDRKVAYIADRLSEFGWYKATLFASEFVMAPLREHMAGLIAAMPDDTSEGE